MGSVHASRAKSATGGTGRLGAASNANNRGGPLLVPGLLQTPDYVRGIMTAAGVPAREIALRVTSRVGRRVAIEGKNSPADLLVLMGQSALNQGIGGRSTMIASTRLSVGDGGRRNIESASIPDHRGWHPGLEGPFVHRRGTPRQQRAASGESGCRVHRVRRDNGDRNSCSTRPPMWTHTRRPSIASWRYPCSPDASANLISEVRKRMEKSNVSWSHWRKSSSSENGGSCVELRNTLEEVRDSKNPGPTLRADVRQLTNWLRRS